MLRWTLGAAGAWAVLAAVGASAQAQDAPNATPASQTAAGDQEGAEPKAKPIGNPGEWITDEDYPREAFRDNVSGTTGFRLDLDEQGVPTHCSVTEPSGSAQLDAATCARLIERARFHPVVDESGRAVPGSYENRVRWSTWEPAPDPNATTPQPLDMSLWVDVSNLHYDPAVQKDRTAAYDLVVDETGGVKSCRITESSGDELFDQSVCRQLEVNASFEVASSGPGRYSGSHTEPDQLLRIFPRTDRVRPGARNYAVHAYIEQDGSVSDCVWIGRNAPDLDPWPVCTRTAWVDQRNTEGKLVRGRVTLGVSEEKVKELENPLDRNNSLNRGLTMGFDEDRRVSVCRWNGPNPPAFDPLLACNFVAENLKRNAEFAPLMRAGLTFNAILEEHEVSALQAEHDAARTTD